MKKVNRVSLRMRVTLLSGVILLICSVMLTIGASYNAQSQFRKITLDAKRGSSLVEVPMTKEQVQQISDYAAAAPMVTEAKKQFNILNLVILVIVSVMGMGMVYVVAGRSLRPIHNLSDEISAIGAYNLQRRISADNRGDEVSVLGNSFNQMLDRLESSFLRQKQFSANVAHELKTPLATIHAGIQVLHLEGSPTAADYKETLETTERNVKRLMKVVDDLLSLYEQEEFQTVPIDLQEMFTSIVSELDPILANKQIETQLQCGLKRIRGNPELLYRACFNLVENAAKYNRDGGRIVINAKEEDGMGQIIIADTGLGIPAGELQKIFEPFYRVNKSRSRKTGGAGLGLSIVKTIAEKHGWQMSVDSEVDLGSTFTLTFAVEKRRL